MENESADYENISGEVRNALGESRNNSDGQATNNNGGGLGAMGGTDNNSSTSGGLGSLGGSAAGNQNPSGFGSPMSDEQAIKDKFYRMVDAIKSGDYARVKAEFGEDAPAEEEFNMMAEFMKNMNFEISNIRINGDRATSDVRITGEVMGETMDQTDEANWIKVNGQWMPEDFGQ